MDYDAMAERVAGTSPTQRTARGGEFPDFSLDSVDKKSLTLETWMEIGSGFLEGVPALDAETTKEAEYEVSQEAGRVFDGLEDVVKRYGLLVVPGSGKVSTKVRTDMLTISCSVKLDEASLGALEADIRRAL